MTENTPNTLEELRLTYIELNPAIRSKQTASLLRTSGRHFAKYLGREPLVTDLTDRNLAGYIRHRQGLGRAPSTCEREASKLMSMWRFAASRAWAVPPMIRIEKARPEEPVAFLKGELRRLFRAVKRYDLFMSPATRRGKVDEDFPPVAGNVVLFALLSAIWDTAERIGALCEVKREDFQPCYGWFGRVSGGWLTITSRKGGGRTMVRKLRRTTALAMIRLLACNPHAKPFGFVHRGTLYYHLESVLRLAGLPTNRKYKFHCLRKSHASYLKLGGGDSTDSLGHSSEDITRVRYHDKRITRRWHAPDYLFNPSSWLDRLRGLFAR